MSKTGVFHIERSERQCRRRRSLRQTMQWDATLPDELVERIWNDPNCLLADGVRLQEKPRCSVARIDDAEGGYTWKRHYWGNFGRTLRKIVSQPVARKCWVDGRFLNDAGVPTPRPRLYLERRLGPVNTSSYLLTDYISGTSLYRFLRYHQPNERILLDLARQVADIWQKLDDLRIQHNDFKTENFIVDPQGKLWLIDLERLRRYRRTDQTRRKQIRDLDDFLHPRNWRANPAAADAFRGEILRTPAAIEALADGDAAMHPLSRTVDATNKASQLATVLIPCRDAADTILACLESVRDMADEILVADAGSTDDTLSLVRQFGGCRILQRQSTDPAAFESWACKQARHPWVLRLPPNEQVNSELGREVQDVLATAPDVEGFRITRARYFRGCPVNHGDVEKDAPMRLFRKDAVRFELKNGDVQVTAHSNRIGHMRYALTLELCPDLRLHLDDVIRAAAAAAEVRQARRQAPKLRAALWHAPWRFFKSYVLRGGWLDGWAGLHASALSALAVYLRELMLWELQQPTARSAENEAGRRLSVFADEPAAADATVAFPSISSIDESSQRDSDRQQMRPAA